MRVRVVLFFFVLSLLIGSRAARADEPLASSSTPPAANASSWAWYGWQPLLADGTAFGFLGLAVATNKPAFAIMGGATYVLGGPIIHSAHGRESTAGVDLLLRAALPVVFAEVGYRLTVRPCSADDWCLEGALGALGGAAIGIGTAMILDATVLSLHRAPSPTPLAAKPRTGFTITPFFTPTRGGGSGGFGGSF